MWAHSTSKTNVSEAEFTHKVRAWLPVQMKAAFVRYDFMASFLPITLLTSIALEFFFWGFL